MVNNTPTETVEEPFFATVLVAAFDFDLKAKPKRRSNVAGFHGDMCAIGFAQTILHLEHFTGNDELLTGTNGRHVIGLIAGHRPEMAEPVRLHLAGGERLEQGRSVAKLLLQTCERNGYKTKSDSMGMVMAIPTSLRICREGMADHFGVAFEELVEPLRR